MPICEHCTFVRGHNGSDILKEDKECHKCHRASGQIGLSWIKSDILRLQKRCGQKGRRHDTLGPLKCSVDKGPQDKEDKGTEGQGEVLKILRHKRKKDSLLL